MGRGLESWHLQKIFLFFHLGMTCSAAFFMYISSPHTEQNNSYFTPGEVSAPPLVAYACALTCWKISYFDRENTQNSGAETISQMISPLLLHAWIRRGLLLLYDSIYCSVVCTWINRVDGVEAVSPWYLWIAPHSAIFICRRWQSLFGLPCHELGTVWGLTNLSTHSRRHSSAAYSNIENLIFFAKPC